MEDSRMTEGTTSTSGLAFATNDPDSLNPPSKRTPSSLFSNIAAFGSSSSSGPLSVPIEEIRLGDLRPMLDPGAATSANSGDRDRITAMKKLLEMIVKGRDVSSLFPDVVKNVVTRNVELRKLVYVFLVHYAESQPQEALLAINSLQRALTDQNQLLRASALRCMSNIRVREIAQLVVMAVQKGSKDSSAYVRKTAALAVPKIVRLDARHSEQCVEVVGSLLRDTTMVVGAAAQAWLEVCPSRYDLVHPCFHRLCQGLPDVDEWGQVSVINLLLRYGRSQFLNPDPAVSRAQRKGEGGEEEDINTGSLDKDHRMLLNSCNCLLQSRNTAVVLATCALQYYLAPPSELGKIVRPLIRLVHSGREVQYVALLNVLNVASRFPRLFGEFVSDFFINDKEDASYSMKNLKLQILTLLANESNITRILHEVTQYTRGEDKEFVRCAIQAIGRCAAAIPEVSDTCMNQLLALMTAPNQSQLVVAETVVVVKKLLQQDTSANDVRDIKIVKKLARLLSTIENAEAKSAIVWLIGEYGSKIPTVAPDVLRTLAKSFSDEQDDVVKLQTLTLAAKLRLMDWAAALAAVPGNAADPSAVAARIEEMLKYVLQVAKYDQSYDVRDRARAIRLMMFGPNQASLNKADVMRQILLSKKPVPSLSTELVPTDVRASETGTDSCGYVLGTMSHVIKDTSLEGYEPLPEFPTVASDPSLRNPAPANVPSPSNSFGSDHGSGLGADDEQEPGDVEDDWNADQQPQQAEEDEWGSGGDYQDVSNEAEADAGGQEEEGEEDDDLWNPKETSAPKKPQSTAKKAAHPASATAAAPKPAAPAADPFDELFNSPSSSAKPAAGKPGSQATPNIMDALLSLDTPASPASGGTAVLTPSAYSAPVAATTTAAPTGAASDLSAAMNAALSYKGPAQGERTTILKGINGRGLSVDACFVRKVSMLGVDVSTLLLCFRGPEDASSTVAHTNVRVSQGKPESGQVVQGIPSVPNTVISVSSGPSSAREDVMSVKVASFTKPLKLEVSTNVGTEGDVTRFQVSYLPAAGDLLRPMPMSDPKQFDDLAKRLSGMYKSEATVDIPEGLASRVSCDALGSCVQAAAFATPVVMSTECLKFAAEAVPFSGTPVLIVVSPSASALNLAVHTENAVVGSLLIKQLVAAFKKLLA